MLGWAIICFVVAMIAGFLGFAGGTSIASGVAQILFFIFLIIFAVTLILGSVGRRRV
jgi:uncharacterized membrane protein YtjA (UPF0391 family)